MLCTQIIHMHTHNEQQADVKFIVRKSNASAATPINAENGLESTFSSIWSTFWFLAEAA